MNTADCMNLAHKHCPLVVNRENYQVQERWTNKTRVLYASPLVREANKGTSNELFGFFCEIIPQNLACDGEEPVHLQVSELETCQSETLRCTK